MLAGGMLGRNAMATGTIETTRIVLEAASLAVDAASDATIAPVRARSAMHAPVP
jgi:hypothetical protein